MDEDETALQPEEIEELEAQLPPGWFKVKHTQSGDTYFADVVTFTVQWHAPPAHVITDWLRHLRD